MDGFAHLRELLSEAPSPEAWEQLCWLLHDEPQGEERLLALEYANQHLDAGWQDQLRRVPLLAFLPQHFHERDHSIWSLFRHLDPERLPQTITRLDQWAGLLLSEPMRHVVGHSIPFADLFADRPNLFQWLEELQQDLPAFRADAVWLLACIKTQIEELEEGWADDANALIFLSPKEMRFGWSPSNPISMPDDLGLSRTQGSIAYQGFGFVFYDFGSSNRPYLNQREFPEKGIHALEDGDVLECSELRWEYHEGVYARALRLDALSGLLTRAPVSGLLNAEAFEALVRRFCGHRFLPRGKAALLVFRFLGVFRSAARGAPLSAASFLRRVAKFLRLHLPPHAAMSQADVMGIDVLLEEVPDGLRELMEFLNAQLQQQLPVWHAAPLFAECDLIEFERPCSYLALRRVQEAQAHNRRRSGVGYVRLGPNLDGA